MGSPHDPLMARVRLQLKAGYHAEESRSAAARGPQQIGVAIVVGVHQLTIRQHHIDGADAQAGRPPDPRVPSITTAEDEPADTDRRRMAGGEKEPVRRQCPDDFRPARGGPNAHPARAGVHLHIGELRQVDEQTTVADAVAHPAVTT